LDDDQLIKRLDWQQIAPNQVQYTFNLKFEQEWGYSLRYEGTSLILSLRHPPKLGSGELGVGNGELGMENGEWSRMSNQRIVIQAKGGYIAYPTGFYDGFARQRHRDF
jgi:hypothetical protein